MTVYKTSFGTPIKKLCRTGDPPVGIVPSLHRDKQSAHGARALRGKCTAAASRILSGSLLIWLSGCATPQPSVAERLPSATAACQRIPLGVPLREAAATALNTDGTLLMGGSPGTALFALRTPKNCGCKVELDGSTATTSVEAQCA